jgi:hypothetical protein
MCTHCDYQTGMSALIAERLCSLPQEAVLIRLRTIPMHRPMQAEAFQRTSVKLQECQRLSVYKKTMTLHTYKLINFWLSILMHQTIAMPGVLSLSRLLLSLPLFPMLPPYLWSSLRSFPIPWPCLLPFHCKSSFYILFYMVHFHLLTVALFIHCLVVMSPRICLTRHLNPS